MNSENEINRHGGCLCGEIQFEITGPLTNLCYCHCHSCRRATGAPFVAWGTISNSQFHWLQGEPIRFRSSSRATRSFCGSCGTSLTYQDDSSKDKFDITLATITLSAQDSDSGIEPECHIWIEDKLPSIELTNTLPQYQHWRTTA